MKLLRAAGYGLVGLLAGITAAVVMSGVIYAGFCIENLEWVSPMVFWRCFGHTFSCLGMGGMAVGIVEGFSNVK